MITHVPYICCKLRQISYQAQSFNHHIQYTFTSLVFFFLFVIVNFNVCLQADHGHTRISNLNWNSCYFTSSALTVRCSETS